MPENGNKTETEEKNLKRLKWPTNNFLPKMLKNGQDLAQNVSECLKPSYFDMTEVNQCWCQMVRN